MKTITIENAKRLTELGIRSTTSHFIYMDCGGMGYLRPRDTTSVNPCDKLFPAFTACELGDMLPPRIKDGQDECILCCTKFRSGRYNTGYGYMNETAPNMLGKEFVKDTEADSRATLLIWLLETGHITAAEVNAK